SGSGGCLFVTGQTTNPTDADYVKISAMQDNSPNPATLVDEQTAILQTDGSVTVTFGPSVIAGQPYYIRVVHRNAVETWSGAPVTLPFLPIYDFSSAATQAYGSNMIDIGSAFGESPLWAFYSGDISDAGSATVGIQDGVCESQDYGDMENAVSVILQGYVFEDITGDGVVESSDYSIEENNVSQIIFTQHP